MMKRKFRLGCAVPFPTDGTSWHRALGPLEAMAAESRRKVDGGLFIVDRAWPGRAINGDEPNGIEMAPGGVIPQGQRVEYMPPIELELVHPRRSADGHGWELTWDWVLDCDAIFLQRPAFPVHAQFAKLVKGLEKPLWVEWDDDYTCLPPSNPHYEQYCEVEKIMEAIREIALLADVVTVATPELKRRICGMLAAKERREHIEENHRGTEAQSKVVVVPNACHSKFYDEPRRRCVMWRGTDTHQEDVCTVLKELGEVSRLPQYSNWRFHFSGGPPWQVYQAIPRERYEESPFSGPVFFVPLLACLGGWVHIVPLKNNAFNQCKSNVAWIEATCAGSVVLAPNGEEWQRPGIVNYRTPQEFAEKLRGLMQEFTEGNEGNEVRLHPNVELSRRWIRENLMLENVNGLRWEIVRGFAAKERKEHKVEQEVTESQ